MRIAAPVPPAAGEGRDERPRSRSAKRSLSRNRDVPVQMSRPISRGRTPAGIRRTRRWINDHFVFAHAHLWSSSGVSEEELADRLDHMLLKVEHRGAFSELFEEGNEAVRDAFRRGHGVLSSGRRGRVGGGSGGGGSGGSASGGSGGGSSSKKQGSGAISGQRSARAVLAAMYQRIEKRRRPLLLKAARRAMASADPAARSFVLDMELVLQAFYDGSLVVCEAVSSDGTRAERASECSCAACGAPEEYMGAPFALGSEAAAALNVAMRVRHAQPTATAKSTAVPSAGEGPQLEAALELNFADGYYRALVHALAEFYGMHPESLQSGNADERVLLVWPTSPGRCSRQQDPLPSLRRLFGTALPAASSAVAAAPVGGAGAAFVPPPASAGPRASSSRDRPPLVPLFLIHARSISAEEPMRAGAPLSGARVAPSQDADPVTAIASAAAAAALAHLRATAAAAASGCSPAGVSHNSGHGKAGTSRMPAAAPARNQAVTVSPVP